MGGIGSGRTWGFGKDTTAQRRALDVRALQRRGMLRSGEISRWTWERGGAPYASALVLAEHEGIVVTYSSQDRRGDKVSATSRIRLEWTPCHYGGQRAWFQCPTPGCERRAAILYGGTTFTCRHCGELAYASQGERLAARAIRRVHKIRERLGWGPSLSFEHGDKPKGMHWATFERLVEQHDALAVAGLEGMVARMGR